MLLALPLLAITFVSASYLIHSMILEVDVKEPFSSVEYSIIGDGGNWNGVDKCSDLLEEAWKTYTNEELVDVDGLYAGESRKFCVRITNEAEADIDYTIESEVLTGYGNYNECVDAFGEETLTGTVGAEELKIDGLGVEVSQDATPVEDCKILVSVSRG